MAGLVTIQGRERKQMVAFEEKIGPKFRSILVHAARIAQQQGASLWLVGGVIRDLLLNIPVSYDLDLVVEGGDSIALACALADALGGTVIAKHPEFGTASIGLPSAWPSSDAPEDIRVIDVAMARTEIYPAPASLPRVSPAALEHDLARRDYRINAMAIQVQLRDQDTLFFSPLLDPFDGMGDLQARVLQVLHERSFDDDPTRIIRGLRLVVRLGFAFAPPTLALLRRALELGRIEQTSGERIRNELCLVLSEPAPEEVLRQADAIGLTPHVLPALRWTETLAIRCQRVRMELSHSQTATVHSKLRSLLMLGVLTYDLTGEEREACIARYRLSGDVAALLRDIDKARHLLPQLVCGHQASKLLKPSEVDRLLRPLKDRALQVVELVTRGEMEAVAKTIANYRTHLRPRKPLLNGRDLQRLGVQPGPQLGQLLHELHAAYLDGTVNNRADAEAWVIAQLSRASERSSAGQEQCI